MTWHFASIWEAVADAIPDAPALACGPVRRTWREYDDRAARFASALEQAGLGSGAKVGLYASNCNEYLEAQFGIFQGERLSDQRQLSLQRSRASLPVGQR